ncbi:hypothetical protein [Geminisphaera colitermitum]|uniref:hypothetical protein n=1 Tax=Geminisphaera colitermitum TaxID=1148786 RepID=UPI000158C60F|nr:hypothetical protein [Geminisphaera colitermitum]
MNLRALLSLDTAGFTGPLAAARSAIGGILGPLAALAGVGAGVGGILAGIKGALDLGGELSDLSANTGIAVADLVRLRQAFSDAAAVAPTIGLMQKAIAGLNESGQPTKKIFADLGIDLAALKKLGAEKQFEAIAGKIRDIKNPAEQTSAAMEIFGRSGASLLALFKDGDAMANAAKVVGSQADILQRNAVAFDKASDTLAATGVTLRGLFVGMAEPLVKALGGVLDKINSIDLAPFGQKLSETVLTAVSLFKTSWADGTMFTLINTTLTVAIKGAVNLLAQGIGGLMMGLAGLLSGKNFWSGLLVAITGLGEGLVAAISAITSPVIAALDWMGQHIMELIGKIPVAGKALGLDGFKAAEFSDINKYYDNAFTSVTKGATGQAAKMTGFTSQQLMQELKVAGAMAAEGFKNEKVFDLGEDMKTLGDLWNRAREAAIGKADTPTTEKKEEGKTTGPAEISRGLAAIVSDRLAKIGGFVGGSGGPSVDYARRTATAAEKMREGIERIASRLTPNTGATAVYA